MRSLTILLLAVGLSEPTVQSWLEHAFYPVLFLLFVVASLGVPIPEDVPLIAAGVILRTHAHVATWNSTLLVSLCGILSGDMILYSLGRRWGPNVFAHRSVNWLITPHRLRVMTARFHRWGVWMCFFGRLVVGVRAAMCLTAGVTRFPFWRFLLADLGGALLSIPLFVGLGYFFAGMIPALQRYVASVQWLLIAAAILAVAGIVWLEWRLLRRHDPPDAQPAGQSAAPAAAVSPDAIAAAPAAVRSGAALRHVAPAEARHG